MAEEKIVDFLRAAIDAEPEFHAPSVAAVRMQVRTGASVPPKKDMVAHGYQVLIWSLPVDDTQGLHNFLAANEEAFTNLFKAFDVVENGKVRKRLSYNGTYPVHGTKTMKSMFSGERDLIAMVEKARTQGAGAMANNNEKEIANGIRGLLAFARGPVTAEILDPTV